jgi:hypothetical protein
MPAFYVPLTQNPLSRVDLIVRIARGDPMQLAPGVTVLFMRSTSRLWHMISARWNHAIFHW